ncbi:MAG TPA: MarR family transcriptional regulator [Thermoanaerobaculia bacterium]|jgi:DNA-binding MarR family transcriptional regulator|nr:MarR family transcriptional regulator [Thermoanaerobaculia bacterium]
MGEALSRRLQQEQKFPPHQEAMLNLLAAADEVRTELDRACDEFGLTHAQYNVLRIVRGAPEGRARTEIGARMLDRAPDVTRILDRLEQRGLVERARGAEDKRQSIARITRKGAALLDEMDPRIRAVHEWFASKITRADAKELSRIAEKIYG